MENYLKETIKEPVHICEIAGSNFLTNGELSVITGLPKSGKSLIIERIIATAFMEDISRKFYSYDVRTYYSENEILYFNTTKTVLFANMMVEHIFNFPNVEGGKIFTCNLFDTPIKNRIGMIEMVIENSDKPYFIVVDSVMDFCSNVDDEIEANEVINFFMSIANDLDIPILLKTTDRYKEKPRGHFGQQLERKCSAKISVHKEDGKLSVSSEYCRYGKGFEKYTVTL